MSKIKNYCYKTECGPAIQTGFHHEQYYVCKLCKEEVTESLKEMIDNKIKDKTPPPKDENFDEDLFSLQTWNIMGDDI